MSHSKKNTFKDISPQIYDGLGDRNWLWYVLEVRAFMEFEVARNKKESTPVEIMAKNAWYVLLIGICQWKNEFSYP